MDNLDILNFIINNSDLMELADNIKSINNKIVIEINNSICINDINKLIGTKNNNILIDTSGSSRILDIDILSNFNSRNIEKFKLLSSFNHIGNNILFKDSNEVVPIDSKEYNKSIEDTMSKIYNKIIEEAEIIIKLEPGMEIDSA